MGLLVTTYLPRSILKYARKPTKNVLVQETIQPNQQGQHKCHIKLLSITGIATDLGLSPARIPNIQSRSKSLWQFCLNYSRSKRTFCHL